MSAVDFRATVNVSQATIQAQQVIRTLGTSFLPVHGNQPSREHEKVPRVPSERIKQEYSEPQLGFLQGFRAV